MGDDEDPFDAGFRLAKKRKMEQFVSPKVKETESQSCETASIVTYRYPSELLSSSNFKDWGEHTLLH